MVRAIHSLPQGSDDDHVPHSIAAPAASGKGVYRQPATVFIRSQSFLLWRQRAQSR